MDPERQPIVVGVGQLVHRATDAGEVLEPMEMMERVARAAATDAEAPRLLERLDSVTVINLISWTYSDPAGRLAARLGADPRERLYTSLGGNSPQWRVNETAHRIARGEVDLALIAGAEAMYGLRLARKAGGALDWPSAAERPAMVGDTRWGTTEEEQRHHAQAPTQIYPLFENALRAHRGWSIPRHREFLARFCARFAAIARDNPYAWFREAKSADQIGTVRPDNRMIAFPYPKYMNAIMDVDQAAALLLTSVATARRLGIPERKWVYVRGGGDAFDHWFVSDRVDYHSSPAIQIAGERALRQAGLAIADVDFLDLYSCFPCAPQIAAEMLGLPLDDGRPLTVTGGLPYHGGPGNNYTTHAIATMVEKLRGAPGKSGLVSAVGWYLTKHAVGVYSSAPPPDPRLRDDPHEYQRIIDGQPSPPCVAAASGLGTVETYTVVHDREGAPALGILVVRLADGQRCWANVTDAAVLERIEQTELVGTRGQVRHHETTRVNLFEP
jgi:acetyl-CoA C-acetyltransferase